MFFYPVLEEQEFMAGTGSEISDQQSGDIPLLLNQASDTRPIKFLQVSVRAL